MNKKALKIKKLNIKFKIIRKNWLKKFRNLKIKSRKIETIRKKS